MPTFWAKIGEFSDVEKTSGFRVLNVRFRVFFGYYFSGSGRIRVAGFRVFGYPNTTLSEGLFQRGIENFEKRYAITGVLEHFNESIKVFEAFLPKYFKGSEELFHAYPELLGKNKNTFKPKVSNAVRQLLAKNMSKEIEFYHLAKQRLIKQYMSIK